ncbi:MAG: sigma-70 family RNA polymerase sigma factor [Planctomycetota bacterium]
MDDASLLARHVQGDEEAFRHLLERYAPMVRAVCRRRLKRLDLADDAAQAVFMVLATKASTIREPRALASWLHRAAVNACSHVQLSETRRHHRERAVGEETQREQRMLSETSAGEDQWAELRPHLDAAVHELRPAQRDAVVGFYLQGKSQSDVAAELGCSEAAVKMRLQSAMDSLRSILSRRGVVISGLTMAALLSGPARAEAVDQGFIAACTAASKGGATPAAQAIAQGMLQQSSVITAKVIAVAATIVIAGGATAWTLMGQQTPPQAAPLLPIIPALVSRPEPSPPVQQPLPVSSNLEEQPVNKLAIAATATAVLLAGNPVSAQAADDANPAPNSPPAVQRTGPQSGSPALGQQGAGGVVNVNGTNLTTVTSSNQMARWAGMTQAQEVELVQISATFSTVDGGDKKGLARWAELEAEGYKIAHVVTSGSQMFVFLERPVQRYGGPTEEIRLPEVVEQDKALATAVREKVKLEQATRAEARMKQMQQWDRGDRNRGDGATPGLSPAPSPSPTPRLAPGF